jgi:hypothetical protein
MSEGYRDDMEQHLLDYFTWSKQQERHRRQFQTLISVGLLGFNVGFVVWNVQQLQAGWSWVHAGAVVVHGLTVGYLAWKLWPRREPPDAGEETT